MRLHCFEILYFARTHDNPVSVTRGHIVSLSAMWRHYFSNREKAWQIVYILSKKACRTK